MKIRFDRNTVNRIITRFWDIWRVALHLVHRIKKHESDPSKDPR